MNKEKTGFHSVELKRAYPIPPLEASPCPLCDAHDDYVLATKGFPNQIPVRNVICKGCGLIRIDPRMSSENYELFYKEDFFGYLNPFARHTYVTEMEHTRDDNYMTPTKKKILPYILPYVVENARVLDVGAGLGQMMYLLKKERSATAIGLEPDPYSRQVAKEKMGVDLVDMTIEEFLKTNSQQFDFIYLEQTFEHLLAPLETLQGLARTLSPEGVIYIGVPAGYNPFIHMKLFYQLAHTYNYTPHTMRLFAEQSGLKLINVREPKGYPLEVLMARKDASYETETEERMKPGSDWREVVHIHRRKRFWNASRGFAKTVLSSVGGAHLKDSVKTLVDRLIGYRY
jgi:SAM-dependent methyltransferase